MQYIKSVTGERVETESYNINILSKLPKKPAVYKLYCSVNGKTYIGITTDIHRRIIDHRKDLKSGKHPNAHLQNAWNKYGKESLTYEIIELFNAEITDKELLIKEAEYMSLYKALDSQYGFNINSTDVDGTVRHTEEYKKYMSQIMTGRVVSKETGDRISKSLTGQIKGPIHTEDFKNKMSLFMTNRVVSEETKEKMSKSRLGKSAWNKGKKGNYKHSEKTKQEMSKNRSGHLNARAICIQLQDGFVTKTIKEACGRLGITRAQIYTLLKKGKIKRAET
jgi:group I intron endonuclease